MINSNNPHSQFELFPKDSGPYNQDAARLRSSIKDLTLSIENIIVVGIVLLMTFVLFFSFGVERGRRLSVAKTQVDPAKKSVAEPFVQEMPVSETISLDTQDLAAEAEEATKEEIISVPIEKQLTDEQIFTIQVASFKQESSARKEADSLGHMGTDIFVVPKGGYSIVCVGKFSEREKAKQFSKRLKTKYRDLLVRSL